MCKTDYDERFAFFLDICIKYSICKPVNVISLVSTFNKMLCVAVHFVQIKSSVSKSKSLNKFGMFSCSFSITHTSISSLASMQLTQNIYFVNGFMSCLSTAIHVSATFIQIIATELYVLITFWMPSHADVLLNVNMLA